MQHRIVIMYAPHTQTFLYSNITYLLTSSVFDNGFIGIPQCKLKGPFIKYKVTPGGVWVILGTA